MKTFLASLGIVLVFIGVFALDNYISYKNYEDTYYVHKTDFTKKHDKLIADGLNRYDELYGKCPHKVRLMFEPVKHWSIIIHKEKVPAVGWTRRNGYVYISTIDNDCEIINTMWHELLHDCNDYHDCYDKPDCWTHELDWYIFKFNEEGLCSQ
jgi:hypothetical protein